MCVGHHIPFIESKYTKVKVLVTQLCPTLCDHMDCGPPGSSVHGILQARILRQEYWSGWSFPSSGHLPISGIEPWSRALRADSLLPESQRKIRNTLMHNKKLNTLHVLFYKEIIK